MNSATQSMLDEFEDAIEYLRNADSQNSSKGAPLKKWFEDHFNSKARVSVVNEAKQAGNRASEQINAKNKVDHVVFVVTDPAALKPLIKHSQPHVYPELKTILYIEATKGISKITPVLVFSRDGATGAVEKFYKDAFPQIEIQPLNRVADSSGETHPIDIDNEVVDPLIGDDDEVYNSVLSLLNDGYAGVIFTGYPGTSKSWYARQVGLKLVNGDTAFLKFIQFHPGYQYEDFIESYVPNQEGGFELSERVFLRACNIAKEYPEKKCVIIIDELTRTDVVRVFGEALTYLEKSKRGLKFSLASGRQFSVPDNLIVICTMNPWDRGVEELDLALERRFAKISFEPNVGLLRSHLESTALSEERREKLVQFFYIISRHTNKLCNLGHAYFLKVQNDEGLVRLWDHQLSFHFKRVLRNDTDELEAIEAAWARIFQ